MPRPTFDKCVFDPNHCPLLQGLSPDEQKARMESDPLIRACVRAVEGGDKYPDHCTTPARPATTTAKSPRAKIATGA